MADNPQDAASLKSIMDAVTSASSKHAENMERAAKAQGEFVTDQQKSRIENEKVLEINQQIVEAAEALERYTNSANLSLEKRRDIENDLKRAQDAVVDSMVDAGIRRDEALEKQKHLNELTEDEVQFLKAQNDERKHHNKLLTEAEGRQKRIKDTTEATRQQTAGIVGNVTETVLGFKNFNAGIDVANISIRGVAEGFTDVFNISNLILNVVKGMVEQMYALNEIQSQFTKETGMGATFAMDSMDGARQSANQFAGALIATREEASQAVSALTTGLPAFTRLTQEGRNELAGMTTALQQVGVDGADSAIILNEMMSVMNIGALEAGPILYDLTEQMHQFGITPKEFTSNLATMLPRFAEFGKSGSKIMMELSKKAKALNVEMSSIVEVAAGFDTFEDAAPKVASLNALMSSLTGTNADLFNSFDLVMETDPAKKFEMLTSAVDASGLSISEMAESSLPKHKFALRAMAQTLNMNTSEFIKMYSENRKGNLEMVEGQKNLADSIKDAQTPSEIFQAVMQDLLPNIKELALGFKDFMGDISVFAKESKEALRSLAVMLGLLGSIGAFFLGKGLLTAAMAKFGLVATGAFASIGGGVTLLMTRLLPFYFLISALAGLIVGISTGSFTKGLSTTGAMLTGGIIGDLPAMADGGVVGNQGTMALVGERGPEIVGLPPRASVTPLPSNGSGNSETRIAKAVADAIAPIMDKVNTAIEKMGDSNVYLDGNRVGKFVDKRMVGTMGKYIS